MINRQIESTFCDDIREEIGGKLSFMGVYSGSLSASQFPVVLPKFVIFVRILLPFTLGFAEDIEVQILQDDAVIHESKPSSDNLMEGQRQVNKPEYNLAHVSTAIVFSPFKLDKPCVLRVKVFIDGHEHRAAALAVVKAV